MEGIKGKQIALGILIAFAVLVAIVGIVGSLYILVYVISIVLGAIFQVATPTTSFNNVTNVTTTTSPLPISSETVIFLNNTEQSYFTVAGYVTSGAEFSGSLISIAVILLVFSGLIIAGSAYAWKKWGKGGKGEMDY